MRIVMISPIIGDAFGQERVMRISARLLRDAGHAVYFVGDRQAGELPPLDGTRLMPGLSSFNALTPRETIARSIAELRVFLKDARADLVHFIDGFEARIVAAVSHEYPTVYTAHTVSPTCPASQRLIRDGGICTAKSGYLCVANHHRFGCLSFLRNDLHRAWTVYNFLARRKTLRAMRYAMAISRYVENTLIADGWPREKVRLVHNPVEIPPGAVPASDAPKNLILSASRLVKLKGVDHLLRAVKTLPAAEWSLWICGEGDDRASLEALSRDLGLQSRVRFLGAVDYRRMASLMAAAAVVVQPNLGAEGFGLSVAEASALGRPVVIYDRPALNELILHDRNGLVVPPGDVVGLGQALARLIGDEDLRHRLGTAGPLLMRERFSPEKHLEATLATYRDALV